MRKRRQRGTFITLEQKMINEKEAREPLSKSGLTGSDFYKWIGGQHLEVPKPIYCCLLELGLTSPPERLPFRVLTRGLSNEYHNYQRCYARKDKGFFSHEAITNYVYYLSRDKENNEERKRGVLIKEPIRAIPFYSGKWSTTIVDLLNETPASFPVGAAEYANYARQVHESVRINGPWGPTFEDYIGTMPPAIAVRIQENLPFYYVADSFLRVLLPGSAIDEANVPWLDSALLVNQYDLSREPWEYEDALLNGISQLKAAGMAFDDESRVIAIFKEHYVTSDRDARRLYERSYVHEWLKSLRDPFLEASRGKREKIILPGALNPGLKETAADYE